MKERNKAIMTHILNNALNDEKKKLIVCIEI